MTERDKGKVKKRTSRRPDLGIREVSIRLPPTQKNKVVTTDFFWSEQGKRCVLGKKNLYIPCRTNMDIGGLKGRIEGKTKIPRERMQLFYIGKLLLDDDDIPLDALEDFTDVESDGDIFKARIFLSIQFVVSKIVDEKAKGKETCDRISTDTDNDYSGGRQVFQVVIGNDCEQSSTACFQNGFSVYIEDSKSNSKFDMMNEMKRIECDNFVLYLFRAGYDNTGAFGAIEEEDLRNGALLIPRSARVRILTLAGAIKRRSTVFENHEDKSVYRGLEKGLMGSSAVKAVTLGDDNIYTTKAALLRGWEKKVNDEEALEEAIERTKSVKEHPCIVQGGIDQVRTNCRVDFDGISVRYGTIWEPKKYCCVKHFQEATLFREKFIELRKGKNIAHFDSLLSRIDICEDGYVPREVFETLLEDSLHNNLYPPISASKMGKLLDVCLMTADEQLMKQDWAGGTERTYNLGRIPLPIYHTERFVGLTTALMAECDRAKFKIL